MHHFRAISPKSVLTPQKEISCHIFKMAILTKFFDDLMNHITRKYAGKKIRSFLNVSLLKIMDILLSVFMVSSLYNMQLHSITKDHIVWGQVEEIFWQSRFSCLLFDVYEMICINMFICQSFLQEVCFWLIYVR